MTLKAISETRAIRELNKSGLRFDRQDIYAGNEVAYLTAREGEVRLFSSCLHALGIKRLDKKPDFSPDDASVTHPSGYYQGKGYVTLYGNAIHALQEKGVTIAAYSRCFTDENLAPW